MGGSTRAGAIATRTGRIQKKNANSIQRRFTTNPVDREEAASIVGPIGSIPEGLPDSEHLIVAELNDRE